MWLFAIVTRLIPFELTVQVLIILIPHGEVHHSFRRNAAIQTVIFGVVNELAPFRNISFIGFLNIHSKDPPIYREHGCLVNVKDRVAGILLSVGGH